jgi:autotransporter-associated beta strand protein
MKKCVLIFIVMVLASGTAQAVTTNNTAINSGSWNVPGIWSLGWAPLAGEDVYITSGVTVTNSLASIPAINTLTVTGILQLAHINAIAAATNNLILANGGTLQLRSDASDTFNTQTMRPYGTVTIDVNRSGSGTGRTLTLGGTVVSISSALTQLNFTGGNSYNAGINAMYFNGSSTLNPTSANAIIGAIRGNTSTSNPDGWGGGTSGNMTLTLGGTSTGNTISSITDITGGATEFIINKSNTSTWTITGNVSIPSSRFSVVSAGTLNLGGTWTIGSAGNSGRALTVSGGILGYNNAGAIQTTGTDNWLVINGGNLDNSSGVAITTSTYNPQMQWNGNFTFIGSNGTNSDLYLGNGAVTITNSPTVTVQNANAALTVGGVISGTGFGLTKAGAGTLRLNATNTYNMATTVTGGTLGGTGSVAGALVVSSGTLSPGAVSGISPGTFKVAGDATFQAGGTLLIDIDDTKTQTSDKLVVGGELDISGATLSVRINQFALAPNYEIATCGSRAGYFGTLIGVDGSQVTYYADRIVVSSRPRGMVIILR